MPKLSFDAAEANRLHKEGMSLNKIIRLPGMPKHVGTLSRHMRAAGYAVRNQKRALDGLSDGRLRHLYLRLRKSSYEIAEMYGVTRSPVSRRLNRLRISRPPGWHLVGKNNPVWKGGRIISKQGYVHVLQKGHPMAGKSGYVLEHRLVMAESLGRPLGPREEVHHINGVRDDNRLENLVLTTSGTHQKLHADTHRELWALRREVQELKAQMQGVPASPLKVVG